LTRARIAAGLAGLGRTTVLHGAFVEPSAPIRRALNLPPDGVAIGAYDPRLDLQALDLDLEHWFISQDDPRRLAAALEHARNRRTLLVTVEPSPLPGGASVLRGTVDGATDEQLRELARLVRAASPQVVLVRWAHEMDLSGLYPWAANDPELYRAAFRHVVGIFRAEGAANARFAWSPAGQSGAERFYPGADVVDYVGLTILEDGSWDAAGGLPPQSFRELLAPRYARLAPLDKPMMVAELGVSGPPQQQSAWLVDAAASLREFPAVRALVYFDDQNPPVEDVAVLPDWHAPPAVLRTLLADRSRSGSSVYG
jgi:endoglucanase